MSKLDPETAEELRKSIAVRARLRAFAHVLDFFGGKFEIREGKAVVPGGAAVGSGLGRAGWSVRRTRAPSSSRS